MAKQMLINSSGLFYVHGSIPIL